MAIAGSRYMVNSLLSFLAPSLSSIILLLPVLLGEGGLTLWLLAVGVNAPKWRTQAAFVRRGGDALMDGVSPGHAGRRPRRRRRGRAPSRSPAARIRPVARASSSPVLARDLGNRRHRLGQVRGHLASESEVEAMIMPSTRRLT